MDTRYIIEEVRRTDRDRAMRGAVLLPVFGAGGAEDSPARLQQLRERWHRRLMTLYRAGWPALEGVNLQYARNCPPFGVRTPQASRTCNRILICPFCWARRIVGKVYDRMHNWLSSQEPFGLSEQVTLLEFRTTASVKPRQGVLWRAERLRIAADMIRDLSCSARLQERNAYDARAMISLHSVRLEERKLLVTRSGFLFVPAAKKIERLKFPSAQHRLKVHLSMTRRSMQQAVSRVCAYPKSMLAAPADLLLHVLEAFHGVHLLASAGHPKSAF